MSDRSDEETDEPLIANDRNYYKVGKWTKDGSKVERMLYAGSNLEETDDDGTIASRPNAKQLIDTPRASAKSIHR